jgi:hypothetical protein
LGVVRSGIRRPERRRPGMIAIRLGLLGHLVVEEVGMVVGIRSLVVGNSSRGGRVVEWA